jgi:predicted regulator of Ras-like GTPase activity (Roadblock/LC7/MglB family)
VRDIEDLTRTLDRFVTRIPSMRSAFVVGSDGLLRASATTVSRANADTAAAISTNLLSLAARSASIVDSGRVTITMIEMDTGYIFLLGLADGAALVGHCLRPCDVGQVGYELALLADLVDPAHPTMRQP